MPVYICDGRINIPDGEVFVAPHLYSANGKIKFNVDTLLPLVSKVGISFLLIRSSNK